VVNFALAFDSFSLRTSLGWDKLNVIATIAQ